MVESWLKKASTAGRLRDVGSARNRVAESAALAMASSGEAMAPSAPGIGDSGSLDGWRLFARSFDGFERDYFLGWFDRGGALEADGLIRLGICLALHAKVYLIPTWELPDDDMTSPGMHPSKRHGELAI